MRNINKQRFAKILLVVAMVSVTSLLLIGTVTSSTASAAPNGHQCGSDPAVKTSIALGCRGQGNPIMDMTFAAIRFLSTGVGLVLVGSMIWAGIQYTSSRGDPQATAQAVERIRANVISLLIFIFAYALLNYVIPGAVLQ